MSLRRVKLAVLGLLCALAPALLAAGRAQAMVTHEYLSQIAEVPSTSGAQVTGGFGEIPRLAISAGELYILNRNQGEHYQLNKFTTSSGAFASQVIPPASLSYIELGLGIDEETGDVYLGAEGDGQSGTFVAALDPAGNLLGEPWLGSDTPAKGFGFGIRDVAVDNSKSPLDWAAGDVYVADQEHGVVDLFRPLAGGGEEYVTQITGPEPGKAFGSLVGVAVDRANGEVVVGADTGANGEVDVFEPAALDEYRLARRIAGTPAGPLGGLELGAVAVDGGESTGTGDVYVNVHGVIDQFNATGEYVGHLTGTPEGSFANVEGMAVDPTTHDVYVAANFNEGEGRVVDVFGPDRVVPDVTTAPASNVLPESATLNGTVNPDNGGAATCQFVWGTNPSLEEPPVSCESPVQSGNAPVPVQTTLGKLRPDTTYYYRLEATNESNGLTNPGEASQNQQFTTPGPGIDEESASNVSATAVTFQAEIDPHGAPTSVYFQYGPTGAYGVDLPAPPGAAIGSGGADVEVARHVQGLSAGAVYHYRVVVLSEPSPGVVETFYGVDRTLATQTAGSFALLDGREWEMVSPPKKQGALFFGIGGEIGTFGGMIQAAANGDAVTYIAASPTETGPQGNANAVQVLSTHAPGGWQTQDIATPQSAATGTAFIGQEYRLFSSDLSLGLLQPIRNFVPSLSPEASEQTAYLRTDFPANDVAEQCSDSCYRPLVTGKSGYANVPPGTEFGGEVEGECRRIEIPYPCGPRFEGATDDLSHIVLSSSAPLTPGAPPESLYEWTAGGLRLVSILPDERDATGSAFGNSWSRSVRHAISSDGSRVIWVDAEQEGHGVPPFHLYLRDLNKKETVELDAPQGGSGKIQNDPIFATASSDASRVFFRAAADLMKQSRVVNQEEGELFECEMVEVGGRLQCKLTDLTPPAAGETASDVGEVLGASEDGSYVYFVSDGELATGGVHGDCGERGNKLAPAEQLCTLYVRHDGVTKAVAVLSGEDEGDWNGTAGFNLGEQAWGLAELTARVSPNGQWLAFVSNRELAGYDTHDATSGKPDQEVYLYDASTGRTVCASCDPTGARPTGVEFGQIQLGAIVGYEKDGAASGWVAAKVPGWTPYGPGPLGSDMTPYQSRYLSNDGRLFFDSADALVPQDVNGTWDVYEYEPAGVGGCGTASATFAERSNGCVGLISSGTSADESGFLDASEAGGDVFFLTNAKLSSSDFDAALDVYDAHECTGAVPCTTSPPTPPPPCVTGEACKPAPTPQPAGFGAPASATFSGAGNVAAGAGGVTPRSSAAQQRLAQALRACQEKRKHRRVKCERRARRRYAARSQGGSNAKHGKRG